MQKRHLFFAASLLLFVAPLTSIRINPHIAFASASTSPVRHPLQLPRVVQVAQNPRSLAVSEHTNHVFVISAGRYDYVSGNYAGNGTVTMLNARNGNVLHRVSVGRGPSAVVVDDRANRVLVVNSGDQSTGLVGSVTFLNTYTGAKVKTVTVGQSPSQLVVDVKTWKAFVLTSAFPPLRQPSDGQVKVLAVTRGVILRSVAIGTHPEALALDTRTDAVFALVGSGQISVLSGLNGQLIGTLGQLSQGFPVAIAVDSSASRLFTTSSGDSHGGQGAITALDDRTGTVVHSVLESAARGADWILVDEPANRVLAGESTSSPFPNPDVAVLDAKRGVILHRLKLNFLSSALDPKTAKIYFARSLRTIKVLNPYGWRIVRTIYLTRNAGPMVVTQNTRRLFITNPDNASVTVL